MQTLLANIVNYALGFQRMVQDMGLHVNMYM